MRSLCIPAAVLAPCSVALSEPRARVAAGVRSDNVADDVWVEVQVAQHVGVHPHIVRLVEVRRPPSPPPAHNRQPANGGKDAQVIRDDETDEIYLVMELMAKALAKGKKLKRDTARQHMRSEPPPCAALSIRRSFSQQRTRRL